MKKLLALIALAVLLATSSPAGTLNLYSDNQVTNWGDENVFLSVNIYHGGEFIDTTGPILPGAPFWMEFFDLPPGLYTFDFYVDGPYGYGSHTASVYWHGTENVGVFISGDWNEPFSDWTINAYLGVGSYPDYEQ